MRRDLLESGLFCVRVAEKLRKDFLLRKLAMRSLQTRREFLKSAFGASCAGALSLIPGCAGLGKVIGIQRRRPNILFLITDDQRFDTIAALGNSYIRTPNMDKLVRSGTSFTNAYIMGSMSGAVCMPSRAMLLTGRHLFSLKNKGRTIPQEHIMFPELLRKEGYITFETGKWHNRREPFVRSFNTGGNIFFGGMSEHYKVPLHDYDASGEYKKSSRFYVEDKHSSELFSDAAVKFLQSCDGSSPFFMWVSYTAPHDPRTAPEKYRRMYEGKEMPLPRSFMPEHPFDNGEMRIRDEELAPWPRTPDEIRKHLADYYAMITHLDFQIGRVLEALKQTRQADNTIIILCGDNGLAVGRHGLLGKQNLYEHSIGVPLIMCGPGVPVGEKRDVLCYIHDIYPSLCEFIGIEVPNSVESKSFLSSIKNSESAHRSTLFFAYKDFQRAVRDERYKLIEYNVKGKRTTQLYDLHSDPWELRNLADEPDYSVNIRRLRRTLLKWKNKIGDKAEFP